MKENINRLISHSFILIAPFLTLLMGLTSFNVRFIKSSLIGAIVFIGVTALPEGDLEFYQTVYYKIADQPFNNLLQSFLNVKEAKFYISLSAFLVSLFFEHHSIYFGLLYFVFGYYLVNFIFIVFEYKVQILSSRWGKFIFIAFALFFSIRNSLNLAFYTGAIYSIYFMTKAVLNSEHKFLLPIILAPVFHFALAFIFIPILIFLFFKSKTIVCLTLVLITYLMPQNSVRGILGTLANENKGTIVESKYDSYVSEGGIERLNKRYSDGAKNSNFKLSLLNTLKEFIFNYLVNIGLVVLFFYRKVLLRDIVILKLYNLILILWAASNIMLNISNGNRFQIFHLTISVFFFIYLHYEKIKSDLLKIYFNITFPIIFFFGVMSLYASNKFVSTNFFTSNYFIQIFAPTKYEQSN